jgi:hypothetical protein
MSDILIPVLDLEPEAVRTFVDRARAKGMDYQETLEILNRIRQRHFRPKLDVDEFEALMREVDSLEVEEAVDPTDCRDRFQEEDDP